MDLEAILLDEWISTLTIFTVQFATVVLQLIGSKCPLSSLYELQKCLPKYIRKDKEIKGIRIGNMENKINQFADDTACSLSDE